ncbi:unnamed protein product, partial [Symbiodinium sp. CCMP2456]
VDLQWKATLSKPAELLVSFIEDVVFSQEYDSNIFFACKQRKEAEDVLESCPFSEKVTAIQEALADRAKGDQYALEPSQDEQQEACPRHDDTSSLQVEDCTEPPAPIRREVEALKPEPRAIVQKHLAACWNKIDTIVQLEAEPEKAVASFMEKRLQHSAIQKLREADKSAAGMEYYVMIVYDCKSAGEASSHPQTRVAPLQGNGSHLKDFVRGILAANSGDCKNDLGPHDLFIIPNGAEEGIAAKQWYDGFKDVEGNPFAKATRTLKVTLDEEGYFSRYGLTRGYSYNLTEDVFCITKQPLDMPPRSGKHFTRSNRSNFIGPVAIPPFTSDHHHMLPWKIKSQCFSDKVKASCRVGGNAAEGAEPLQRKPDALEPMSWHQLTWTFWAELCHSHNVTGIIDCTVGAGYVAEAALREKIPYLGVAMTVMHANLVRQYLFGRMWELMQKPGGEHYSAELHEALGLQATQKAEPAQPVQPAPLHQNASRSTGDAGQSAKGDDLASLVQKMLSGAQGQSEAKPPPKKKQRTDGAAAASAVVDLDEAET